MKLMTSVYPSISIETDLVTHFPVYKIWFILNHNFLFFTYRIITKCCSNWISYFHILSKLATVLYPISFMKKKNARTFTVFIFHGRATFKRPSRYFFLVLQSILTRKNCCETIGHSSVIWI